MKKCSLFLLLIFVAFLSNFVNLDLGFATQRTLAAENTSNNAATISNNVSVTSFNLLDSNTGWVLAEGKLFWTTSNGAKWGEITPPLAKKDKRYLVSSFFVDTKTGWVVSAGSDPANSSVTQLTVFATSDAGQSWTTGTLPTNNVDYLSAYGHVSGIFFSDVQHGWLLVKLATGINFSRSELFATSDGGSSWSKMPSLPVAGSIFFKDNSTGWLVGGVAQKDLYVTQDGGQTWQTQNLVTPTGYAKSSVVPNLPSFQTVQNGILPVYFDDVSNPAIGFYSTQNSGQTWNFVEALALPTAPDGDISIPTVVVGADSYIFGFSAKSGITIAEKKPNSVTTTVNRQLSVLKQDSAITNLSFKTTQIGWLSSLVSECKTFKADCTSKTTLFATNDGAQTLTDISANLPLSGQSDNTPHEVRITNQLGFDKCEAASVANMQTWWNNSPFKNVNIYFGGNRRACGQALLNASWVSQVWSQGWGLIPTWVGPQGLYDDISLDTNTARNQGISEANKAADAAAALGLGTPTVIYYDMENPDVQSHPCSTACRNAVRAFLDGWTAQIHARGHQSGIYSGVTISNDAANLTNKPDNLWIAQWVCYNQQDEGCYAGYTPSVYGIPGFSDNIYIYHQRIHQYRGDHNATFGGVTFNIDRNALDAPVAAPSSKPNPPYHLGTTKAGDGKVKLFWGDGSDNETGFKIERQTLGTSNWVSIGQTPANETLYEDTVPQGVVYHYRVFAYNAAGNSDFTSIRTSLEVPVYRFWNEAAYTPFYTANPDEAHNLRKGSPPGWRYDGVAFYAYREDDCNGRSPIYRYLWSGNSAVHFYGLDLTLGPPDWTYQRIAFCAYAGQPLTNNPIYRLHLQTNANIHFYTVQAAERDSLVNSGLWIYEGVAFYARSAPPQYEIGQASPFANRFRGAYNQHALALNFPDAADRVNEYATSGVGWQPLSGASNAALFHHGAANAPGNDLVRAFIVEGAIKQAYFNMNGPMSSLGPVTSDQYTNTSGQLQSSFANGYIVLNNNVAQTVMWPTSFDGYKTSYFNNVHLWSGPALVRNEGNSNSLNFSYNWGTLTPPLPQHGLTFPDSWSVRWERNWTFAPGTYKFRLCGDDGLRLYLNGIMVVDQWQQRQSQSCFEYNKNYDTTKIEPVKVEYFQGYGGANISFTVNQLTTLTVVEPVDIGDTNAVGTLSYALQNANLVLFNVPGNSISVRGNLPVVGQGIRIMGDCASPITIDGSHPSASNDGFKLSGNNMLQGLKLVGFRGKLLDFNGSLGNTLNCVTIKR
jgi:photosystem II stability/assembly factor-like uncharacterized protein